MARRAKAPSDVLRAYLGSLRSKRRGASIQRDVEAVAGQLFGGGDISLDEAEIQAAALASGGVPSSAAKAGTFLGKDKSQLGRLGKGAAGYFILSKLLGAFNQNREQAMQRGALREQASLATPENLYYQAALPQAQQEESEARQALMMHLSGGVVGPSIATGERMIGV